MTIICDNHILSNIIQFCGRVRLNNTKVYIVDDGAQHPIENDIWLYSYANYDVQSANKYISDLNKNSNFEQIDELSQLRKHLKKANKYLYYNCIERVFKVSHILFNEETRVLNNYDWIKKLQDYCYKYNFHCSPVTDDFLKEVVLPRMLDDMVERELKLFEEIRNPIINMINDVCKSNAKQISKINETLEKNKLSYKFTSLTETKKERRDETYWFVHKI